MPAATRDQEFQRARGRHAPVKSFRVMNSSDGGVLMRCLLLLVFCVLFINGCSANAPSAGNTTATTSDSNVRPITTERAGEVRANERPSPTATGAENLARATTGATAGVASSAQTASNSSSEQGSAEASAAYEGFYEVLGARPKGFEQFGNFMIRAPQGGRISGAVVPLEGEIYEFARATLAERKLTFETKKIGGISYTFDGQFLAAPPFASNKKAAVAEGLVKKFRGTQLASEASMKFYFDEGGEDP